MKSARLLKLTPHKDISMPNKKMRFSDQVAKFLIEKVTTLKYDSLTPYEVNTTQSLVLIVFLLVFIALKI